MKVTRMSEDLTVLSADDFQMAHTRPVHVEPETEALVLVVCRVVELCTQCRLRWVVPVRIQQEIPAVLTPS